MGKAEARDLGLEGGALYDPEVNYRRVKGELWDWADDPAPQQVANDTRALPAANAQVPERPGAEERRVGKERASTCRTRWSQYPYQTNDLLMIKLCTTHN